MNIRIAFLASIVLCLALPASAASITNTDDKDHSITILEAGVSTVRLLKPGDVLKDVCPKGCIVRIGESANDEYEVESADIVSIEDGLLYSDRSEGAPGSAGEPKAPPAKP